MLPLQCFKHRLARTSTQSNNFISPDQDVGFILSELSIWNNFIYPQGTFEGTRSS